jgi:hypothetical protein
LLLLASETADKSRRPFWQQPGGKAAMFFVDETKKQQFLPALERLKLSVYRNFIQIHFSSRNILASDSSA